MNIHKSLEKMLGLSSVSGNVYRRLDVLSKMVSGILHHGSTRISEICRISCDDRQHASKEKQMRRWLLSDHTTYEQYYLPYIFALVQRLSQQGELTFVIDGSSAAQGCMVLMFSLVYGNRSIPVVWEVVKAKKGHLPETMHRSLLAKLKEIVPADSQVNILGDGEYDGCGFQADILAQEWNYVLRTGLGRLIECEAGEQVKIGSIEPGEGERYFLLNDVAFTQQKYGPVTLLAYHEKGYKTPIYLLSNLDCPDQISQLYKKRFLIETFFSDQKTRGFNIHRSKLSQPKRLAKLLIASCLAYILIILAGVKCLQSKFYQFIHRKDRCDLSLFSLGRRFIEWITDHRQWRSFGLRIEPEKKVVNLLKKLESVR